MATNVMAAVDYKEAVALVVKEYFDSLDQAEVARSLRELQKPLYHYYFVKCVVKTAMDRGDKEKEMAAQLLSSLLCDDVLEPGQVYATIIPRIICRCTTYHTSCRRFERNASFATSDAHVARNAIHFKTNQASVAHSL